MRERSIDTNLRTIKQLQGELESLGIRTSDTVMVHASLRSVGPVENRGQGLTSALLRVLGSEGTLMAYAVIRVPVMPITERVHFVSSR